MVIHKTRERDVMKKALFVILASILASEPSANSLGDYSTGNDWLWQIQSDHSGTQIGAAAYLSGMNRCIGLAD